MRSSLHECGVSGTGDADVSHLVFGFGVDGINVFADYSHGCNVVWVGGGGWFSVGS